MVMDQSTPSCGNSRFGCWTCTVVDRDKASEGLLASGDQRMEALLHFRDTLMEFRNPERGYRDNVRKNGQPGPGPLKMEARKDLLNRLLEVQNKIGFNIISEEELYWIQVFWKSARNPDNGNGVANIVLQGKGEAIPEPMNMDQLSAIAENVCREKGIRLDSLKRMIAKVEEYGESHRAHGLPDELLQILEDDLRDQEPVGASHA